jgi:hypothetical protein
MANNFKVDPASFLGLDYAEYKNNIYAKALSEPSEYFKLRKAVLKKVKTDAVTDLYTTFYNLLTDGTDKGGQAIEGLTDPPPHYPSQKVSEFALSAAKTLDDILNECIEIILPIDYKDLASRRLEEKGRANIV